MGNYRLSNFCGLGYRVLQNLWLGFSHAVEFLWLRLTRAAEFLWPGSTHAAEKFCGTDKLFALKLFLCDVQIGV